MKKNRKIYKENISEDLLNRIKTFLDNNDDEILDYQICMEGYKLASQAFEELFKSREEFHKEYDEIVSNLNLGIDISINTYNKNIEIVNELNDLLTRMKENKEVHTLIEKLYSKKYRD